MATICCSRPITPPSYTICFPDQQIIPDNTTQINPYYDFNVQQSVWTYTIHIDQGESDIKDLSHWVFQICPDLAAAARSNPSSYFMVEVSENGGAFTNITDNIEVFDSSHAEPTTGLFNVLKINRGQPKNSTFTYRITILNSSFFDLAAEAGGNIVIKAGNDTFIFDSCDPPLPTPSYNCNRVPPPTPILSLMKTCPVPTAGNSFKVGDIVTIDLAVTNSSTTTDATNVTVVDLLNIPLGVAVGNFTTDPAAAVTPSEVTYTGNVDITTTWTGLTVLANTTLNLKITFTILDAPFNVTNITNLDAGIGQLSGTDDYKCTIPVVKTETPPTRGIKFEDLKPFI